MSTIKLLHVLEAMGGGTKKLLELVITNTPSDEFDITLALPPPAPYDPMRPLADAAFPDRMRARGYRVVTVPMVGGGPKIAPNLRAALALYRVIRREKYDIVHCWSSTAGFVGRLAAKWAGVPAVIYSPEGFAFSEFVSPWRRRVYIAAEQLLGRFTDSLIACSETEQQQALDARIVPPGKLVLIENPLDTERYDIETIDAPVKRLELGLPEDAPVVGMVARLTPQKGPSYFVEAASLVQSELPHAHFVLVGDGELRAEVEALATELGLDGRLHLLGNRDDYLPIMSTFDVFVLSSLWEGMPYAPLEAMLLQKPVVATDISGARDIIQKMGAGVLVPPMNSWALADAILALLRYPERAAELGRQAEKSVRSRFGIQSASDRLVQLYSELLAAKGIRQPAP